MRILFVCSQNKLRSPTAEQVFADWPGIETSSAGTNHDAENPLDVEQIEWADLIVAMERQHRSKIQQRFRSERVKRLVVLDIPDDYQFIDNRLIQLLQIRMRRFLPT